MPNKNQSGTPRNKPLSLHPLSFEEAVQRMLQAPNPRHAEQERGAEAETPAPKKHAPQGKKRG